MSKLSSRGRGSLGFDVRGFGGVLYDSCGMGGREGVFWVDAGTTCCSDVSGTGLRVGVSECARCAWGGSTGCCECRGDPNSRGPARRPRSPRCSGVLTGDGVAPVGSVGNGLRLMGVLSRTPRGPPTAGLSPPSGRADSRLFSTTGFSAFGLVS